MPYLQGISAVGLDFSRDGKWVAYSSYPEGNLWRSRTDGRQKQQLTWPGLSVAMPRWSPDRTRIAFLDETPGKPRKAYIVSAGGDNLQEIAPEEQIECSLSWSLDGNSVLFGRRAGPKGDAAAVEIGVLDLQTKRVSSLPRSSGFCEARWPPDGRYIAALREVGPKDVDAALTRSLVLYDFADQKWTDLSVNPNAGFPNWSGDSKYVFFDGSPDTADAAFYRVRISDRKLEQLASHNEVKAVITVSGLMNGWTGLAPDGSPLITREVDADEVYAFDVQWP